MPSLVWQRGVKPGSPDARPHGSGLGRERWVVEPTFACLHNRRRLLLRTDRRHETHEATFTPTTEVSADGIGSNMPRPAGQESHLVVNPQPAQIRRERLDNREFASFAQRSLTCVASLVASITSNGGCPWRSC
jgi:hypothetical protein